jgi:hypothetical protein
MHAIVLEIPVWLCEVVLVANLWLHDGYMPLYISLTVATQSFRTAERSLWENGFFENSPKIKFSSDENDFWTGGY